MFNEILVKHYKENYSSYYYYPNYIYCDIDYTNIEIFNISSYPFLFFLQKLCMYDLFFNTNNILKKKIILKNKSTQTEPYEDYVFL